MLSILLQVPRRQNLWLRMVTNSAWSTWIFSCRRLRAILDIFYFFNDFIWIGFFEVSNVVNKRIPTQYWKKYLLVAISKGPFLVLDIENENINLILQTVVSNFTWSRLIRRKIQNIFPDHIDSENIKYQHL